MGKLFFNKVNKERKSQSVLELSCKGEVVNKLTELSGRFGGLKAKMSDHLYYVEKESRIARPGKNFNLDWFK